jgi:hypothetical protein
MVDTVVDPNSPVGQSSGSTQGLTEFAGPYVGEMLGKARALADKPYEAYGGPLTAGASGLQDMAFSGYAGLDPNQQTGIASFGGDMTAGGTFGFGSAAGQGYEAGYTPGSFTGAAPMMGDVQISPIEMQRPDSRLMGGMDFMELTALPVEERLRIRQEGLDAIEKKPLAPVRDHMARLTRLKDAMPAPRFSDHRARLLEDTRLKEQPVFGRQQPPQSPVGQYMNPYLQAALEPQLREARRQADISRVADAGRLTRAGAFGGSRQAIMEAEGGRNLGTQLADITGRGYSEAFTQARDQFNKEQEMQRLAEDARRGQFNVEAGRLSEFDERRRLQANEEARREVERQEREREQFNEQERRRIAAEEADRRYGLSALRDMRAAGQEERGIEQEGITADYLQYQQEQQYPYEQLQFMQSMLQGLPITATSRQFVEPGGFQELSGGLGGLLALLRGGPQYAF